MGHHGTMFKGDEHPQLRTVLWCKRKGAVDPYLHQISESYSEGGGEANAMCVDGDSL